MRLIENRQSAIGKRMNEFGLAIAAGPPSLPRARQLILLCGAEHATRTPSFRREAIRACIESISSDFRVIDNESVLNTLLACGSGKNALDLASLMAALADRIVLILESESAFCELGVFAQQALRRKLIVINSSATRSDPSFVNNGPLAAMAKVKAPVLWYPMSAKGLLFRDDIGAVFNDLKAALKPKAGKVPLPAERNLSDLKLDPLSFYLVHDLILFAGPLSHRELIAVLKQVFGVKPYNALRGLLRLLSAMGLIVSTQVEQAWVYRTTASTPCLEYGLRTGPLMAAFRSYHLKYSPGRWPLG
jgi:hypothetical protein